MDLLTDVEGAYSTASAVGRPGLSINKPLRVLWVIDESLDGLRKFEIAYLVIVIVEWEFIGETVLDTGRRPEPKVRFLAFHLI